MLIYQAALLSLQQLTRPTHLRDLVAHIEGEGYFAFGAQSPERALGVAMDRHSKGVAISRPAQPVLFYRHGPATYGLLEWLSDPQREDLELDEDIDNAAALTGDSPAEFTEELGIARYDFDSVNTAPSAPGIYAWYAKLDAGFADYCRSYGSDGSTDLGERNLRELLLRHSHKFDPEPYTATAKSTFELSWSGTLEPKLATSLERILNEQDLEELRDTDREAAKKVQVAFRREKTRHLLVSLIKKATPFFAAPIYIGMSDNLQRRLGEHTRRILKLCDALAADPEKRNELLGFVREGKGDTFAGRVTALELGPAQLEVYTLNIRAVAGRHAINDTEEESLALCLEWLLNRWHRPLAGRI